MEQNEKSMNSGSCQIYVASLSDYNNGILHGAWIDLEECGFDPDQVWEQVEAMLDASPMAKETGQDAEEWAIHDYEGFPQGSVSESSGFETVCEQGRLIADHGEAWLAYVDLVGIHYAAESAFEEMYQGEWASEEAFAENMLDETGMLDNIPSEVARYFDYATYTHDLFTTVYAYVNGHVFLNC